MTENSKAAAVDPTVLIADGRWSPRQVWMVCIAALTLLVDGFDNGLLAVAAPAVATDWGIERTAFAPAFASGLVGLSLGTVLGGIVGDRIGRKPALIACALMFGLMTLATLGADNITTLCVLRFIAGLGMGGALPNGTALASEVAPARSRSVAISIVLLGGPAGGLAGTLIAAWLLKFSTWQTLFLTGGGAGLAIAAVLILLLSESPAYLLDRPARHTQLRRLLARMAIAVPEGAILQRQEPRTKAGGSAARLFAADLRSDTLTLWGVCFLYLLGLYSLISWGPSLMASLGYTPSQGSLAMSAFQAGTFLGSLIVGGLLNLFGSKRLLWTLQGWAVIWMLLPMALPVLSQGLPMAMAYLAVVGFLLNCTISAVYTVAAQAYPAEVRATGVGATVGAGRVGAVISSFTAAAILKGSDGVMFFALLAGCAAVAMLIHARLKRHIPRAAKIEVAGH